MASFRGQKINNEIKRELSDILSKLKDPRVASMISVIKVEVTKDLKFAKAYVSLFGSEKQKNDAIIGLNAAKGFVRKEVSQRLKLRSTPEFTFVLDDSIEYGAHIMDVIKNINKGDK